MTRPGTKSRDDGIKAATDHADAVDPTWADRAFAFYKNYAERHLVFTTEDVRLASEGVVPAPPHARAWGGIGQRASRERIIKHAGFTKSKREDGHCMNLQLWASTIYGAVA